MARISLAVSVDPGRGAYAESTTEAIGNSRGFQYIQSEGNVTVERRCTAGNNAVRPPTGRLITTS